jgi:hypothetical protein
VHVWRFYFGVIENLSLLGRDAASPGYLERVAFGISGTSYPAVQHLIPEDWNPPVYFVWFSADLSGEDEEVQQVMVKFAQQETDRKRRARERSFSYLSQKSAEEPWFRTEFHNHHSEKAEVCSHIVSQKLEVTRSCQFTLSFQFSKETQGSGVSLCLS